MLVLDTKALLTSVLLYKNIFQYLASNDHGCFSELVNKNTVATDNKKWKQAEQEDAIPEQEEINIKIVLIKGYKKTKNL